MRTLISVFLSISIFMLPMNIAYAGEPAPIINSFDDMPAHCEVNGKIYLGILVSESNYRLTITKIGTLQADLQFSQKQFDALEFRYKQEIKIYKDHVTLLQHEININDNWFNRNKGVLGITVGVLFGTLATIGVSYAVNQPRN